MTNDGSAPIRLALLLTCGGSKIRRRARGVDFRTGKPTALLRGLGVERAVEKAVEESLRGQVPAVLDKVKANGWRWLTPEQPSYPERLRHTADPPLGLFVRGELYDRPSVAIVGSRGATSYGLRAARVIAEAVARSGGIVVSGMARGIDAAAHRGALDGDGITWAVWGAGPDRIYPREHARLAESIAERGALITEYPPGTPPRKHNFPERNRIVAGMVSAVVVVEAAARSGALNTARHALDEDRDVMVVPGSIFSEMSVGPHGLLRLGAFPLTTPKDLVDSLGLEWRDTPEGAEHPLAEHLREGESVPVDVLAERLGQPVEQVLSYLVQLEIEGWIQRDSAGWYQRVDGK